MSLAFPNVLDHFFALRIDSKANSHPYGPDEFGCTVEHGGLDAQRHILVAQQSRVDALAASSKGVRKHDHKGAQQVVQRLPIRQMGVMVHEGPANTLQHALHRQELKQGSVACGPCPNDVNVYQPGRNCDGCEAVKHV